MDSLIARAQTNLIQDMLTSNQIRNFKIKIYKYLVIIVITSTILTMVLNLGVAFYLHTNIVMVNKATVINIDASTLRGIVKVICLFVVVLNILVGCIILIISPILFILTILHICNCVYNYKLFIIRNSPFSFKNTARNIGYLFRDNKRSKFLLPGLGLTTALIGYEAARKS